MAAEASRETASQRGGRLARSTLFFSIATGLSRVLGLVREIVAARYFGVTGPMTAFTIAFQVPNLVRALFADSALQGAFVPVFTDLIEQGKKREAFHVASSLFFLLILVLGVITVIFVALAGPLATIFAPGFNDDPALHDLTVGLSRLMFPIVLLLALSGLVVGMLNSFDRFGAGAIAPVAWNLVIIVCLVTITPLLHGNDRLYAYGIGILVGTAVQFALPLPWLRGTGGKFTLAFDWRNEHVRKVLKLMFPVTIALGLINLSLVINSAIGTLVSEETPAAIDKAFRIYQLPQGLFSISIATILFPTLSKLAARGATDDLRQTMANGMRQIALTLIPSAVLMAVLAEPITRLVYQRGEFDAQATDLVKTAMIIWSISLPFQGISLLFSRTFFSLQQPRATTVLAFVNMVVNAATSFALYKPLGISGIVLGTVVGTLVMTIAQGMMLRRRLGGIDASTTLAAVLKMLAAGALMAVVAYLVWRGVDAGVGRSLIGQILSVGAGLIAGLVVYGGAVWALGVPEARQLRALLPGGRRSG